MSARRPPINSVSFSTSVISFMRSSNIPTSCRRGTTARAVVPRRQLVGIFDDLINEITEVENETELIGGRRALILKDHPAIAVELAFIKALAADKGEIDRPWIVRQRGGDRPADAATVPLSIEIGRASCR